MRSTIVIFRLRALFHFIYHFLLILIRIIVMMFCIMSLFLFLFFVFMADRWSYHFILILHPTFIVQIHEIVLKLMINNFITLQAYLRGLYFSMQSILFVYDRVKVADILACIIWFVIIGCIIIGNILTLFIFVHIFRLDTRVYEDGFRYWAIIYFLLRYGCFVDLFFPDIFVKW